MNCRECIHADDEDYCTDEDCSALWDEAYSCSCHINPPCYFCENNYFEEAKGEENASKSENET